MALPVSAGQQAGIDQLQGRLDTLPSIYNPRRRTLAYDTAATLGEQGYDRGATPTEINQNGTVVYKLVRGADGRLYQQAYRQTNQAHNARGTFYSSFNVRDQQDQRRQLDAARNAIERQMANQQTSLTEQQASDDAGFRGDLATRRGEYADWQAAQTAPDPGAPAAPAAAVAPAPAAATTATPRASMTYADFLKGRKSTSALAHRWDSAYNAGNRFG